MTDTGSRSLFSSSYQYRNAVTNQDVVYICRLHGSAYTHGCPGCADALDAYDSAAIAPLVRSRLRWWKPLNLCARVGHFWRELEPDVWRCRVCKTTSFRHATMEQLERWLTS